MGLYRTFWGAVGDAVVSLQVTVLFAGQHIAVQLLGSLWGPMGHPGVPMGPYRTFWGPFWGAVGDIGVPLVTLGCRCR